MIRISALFMGTPAAVYPGTVGFNLFVTQDLTGEPLGRVARAADAAA